MYISNNLVWKYLLLVLLDDDISETEGDVLHEYEGRDCEESVEL